MIINFRKFDGGKWEISQLAPIFAHPFYRAMHYGVKRGIAIAWRLSVCLSVGNVGGSESHTLEILETNCTDNILA